MAYERRSYSGAAKPTTIIGGIGTTDTTVAITSAAGWPTTTNGPFFATLDRGNAASEERVKVSTRSGTTLTIVRAQDGTTAVNHASGASIEHTYAAVEADEANGHYADPTIAVPHSQFPLKTLWSTTGDILYASSANTPARLGVGSTGQLLTVVGGVPAWAAPASVFAPSGATVATQEATSSASYADLATVGPSVTVTTGTTALVSITAAIAPTTTGNHYGQVGVAVSSATTRAAGANAWEMILNNPQATGMQSQVQFGGTFFVTGLTAGSNVFTLKYRSDGSSVNFANRHLVVVPA